MDINFPCWCSPVDKPLPGVPLATQVLLIIRCGAGFSGPSAPATLRREVFHFVPMHTTRVSRWVCTCVLNMEWTHGRWQRNAHRYLSLFDFLPALVAVIRLWKLRLWSILIALPEEMGGALGNYIRTIFPSPDAISGYIPQTTTERKGNIKVKYFELN